jgi:hypothetical protein
VNYVPYLSEYEGIIPLVFINNSGITGAESKGDSDPTPLMKDSDKYEKLNCSYAFLLKYQRECY